MHDQKHRQLRRVPLEERWAQDSKDGWPKIIRRIRVKDQLNQFLKDELFSLTLQGALQHSKTYDDRIGEKERAAFQFALKQQLGKLANEYAKHIDHKMHLQNIERLAEHMILNWGHILHDGKFKIGSAQKALNLYLKYLWALGKIPMPPHCPFDAIVIGRLPPSERLNWTEIVKIEEYEKLVEAAKRVAGKLPLAVWELHVYNAAL